MAFTLLLYIKIKSNHQPSVALINRGPARSPLKPL